ncbi:hypothetical protein SAMN02799625_05081 [Methylobacterium sp. UNC300MFChir4.1]|uniref:hypothetical protein n=1 Tax=Methylobacterium sp. UNC300MFChir4.1 TaxID=1502747 RepID=UPI0008C601F8|nr:hypothetical protein [Methylobacterium sp. UNC300MFChir4.1]SEP22536.1 hypothetical protein SAMN02799625_05081 [Methylobacterium sp. UNC300MFChir4.1]
MSKITDFPIALIQAINDWQIGGGANKKARNAAALKREAVALPDRFRKCGTPCYRQLALEKGHLYELNDTLQLPETSSAWTVALDVAQQIKGGVPPEGWQGIIFGLVPPRGSVIVNLDRLYSDAAFRRAVAEAQPKIHRFGDGIGRYQNTQREVVVEVNSIHLNQVISLGGYSGTRFEIAKLYYGRDPSFLDLLNLDALVVKSGVAFGPSWVSGAAKDRCISKIQSKAPFYRLIKQLQNIPDLRQDDLDGDDG